MHAICAFLVLGVLAADPHAESVGAPQPSSAVFDPQSIERYFTSGPLADAARQLDAGRAREALRLVPADEVSLPARYLRARALLGAGEALKAAGAFEKLAADWPAMSVRSHCHAATAWRDAGEPAKAVHHLKACQQDSSRARAARFELAQLHVRLGQPVEALEELQPLIAPSAPLQADALMLAGRLYGELGQHQRAIETYRRAYVEIASPDLASQARTRAGELARRHKTTGIDTAHVLDRAERLLAQGRTKDAAASLRTVPEKALCRGATCARPACETPEALAAALQTDSAGSVRPTCAVATPVEPANPLDCRAQMLRGWTARRERAHTNALSILWPVYARCGDPDVRARALFHAIGSARSLRQNDGLSWAVIAARDFAGAPGGDHAFVAAANLARELERFDLERFYLQALVDHQRDSRERADALFRLYWSHRSDGKPARGLAALETLWTEYDAGDRSDGADAERGLYWWGRTTLEGGVDAKLRAQGVARLKQLAVDRPLTYYGMLARSMLVAAGEQAPTTPSVAAHQGPLRVGRLAQEPAFSAGVELLRLGLLQEARESLNGVPMAPLRADGERGQEGILLVAELLSAAGDSRTSHVLVRRELLRSIRQQATPFAQRASMACYPLAFRDQIVSHTRSAGLAANLMQGLMREESALDPRARSPVGARGLTQVMPATGRQVASSLGMARFDADDLWDPDTNIRIGSTYLGRMLRTFGHPGLAAAAYNAGPGAVSRWLERAGNVPFDVFVEDIPYAETRGYVKRVLRSYAAYEHLYGDAAQAMQVSLALRDVLDPPDARRDDKTEPSAVR